MFSKSSVLVLSGTRRSKLKDLDFEFRGLTDASTIPLFEAICASKSITKINIKNNLIHNEEGVQQANNTSNNIVSINFGYNEIDRKAMNDILRFFALKQIRIKVAKEKSYDDVCENLRKSFVRLHKIRGN